jgi:hypothetical protein
VLHITLFFQCFSHVLKVVSESLGISQEESMHEPMTCAVAVCARHGRLDELWTPESCAMITQA